MTASPVGGFLHRLDAVARRFQVHAAGVLPGAHTEPDERTGERWDAGQVWAHLAEFPSYWLRQIDIVLDAWAGEPVPFGRVKTDPDRIAAIDRDRYDNLTHLAERVAAGVLAVRQHVQRLPDEAWAVSGIHQTLGVMSLERIVEEFLVGHFEEHADQLDEVAGSPTT